MDSNGNIMNTTTSTFNNCGSLHIVLGPMFSGKTSFIINAYSQLVKDPMNNPIILNHNVDVRYDTDKQGLVTSHNGDTSKCVRVDKINEFIVTENIKHYTHIFINEGQFFCDLYDSVKYLVEECNKHVYIGALDGDFNREVFGDTLKLVPLADSVTKLKSKCNYNGCTQDALFSYRLTNEQAQTVVGSSNYIPVCRRCYTELTHKSKTTTTSGSLTST